MSTAIQQAPQRKLSFSQVISGGAYQKLINNTIRDPAKAERFVTAIISAVAVNPTLQECTPETIVSGALLGESLGLSPSPQLGQYYLIPRDNKKRGVKEASFQLGYRGYVQLALRSGQYRFLNVMPVKKDVFGGWDELTETLTLKPITDELVHEQSPVVGYVASFEYLNGFRKTIYWSKQKMLLHADRYSQAFSMNPSTIRVRGEIRTKVSYADYEAGNYPKEDEWMYSSTWYTDFNAMAEKTMIRQLISKWGIMSTEMQKAFESDSVLETPDYFEAAPIEEDIVIEPSEPIVLQKNPADVETTENQKSKAGGTKKKPTTDEQQVSPDTEVSDSGDGDGDDGTIDFGSL